VRPARTEAIRLAAPGAFFIPDTCACASTGSIHPCAHSICEVLDMKRILSLFIALLMLLSFALAEES